MSPSRRSGPLAVHEYGEPARPVLLLLHGLGDSGRCWADLVDRLGSTYRIVAPDLLGHGDSARFTPEQLASSDPIEHAYAPVAALLEEIAPERGALVVGHSMGGGLAAALAARRPDLVAAAVLEDPAWIDVYPWGDPAQVTRERVAECHRVAADLDAAVERCRAENPGWPGSELRAWAEAKAAMDEAHLQSGESMLLTPWRAIAGAVVPPTLVVTGDHDVILHATARGAIADLDNPSLQVRVVPGAGHCVRRDRPDAFHALLDPWLAQHA